MTMQHDEPGDAATGRDRKRSFITTPTGFALCLILAAAGLLLWAEHRAHVLSALPFMLPLLICGGMHLFMHRGHGGSDNSRRN